MHIGETRYTTRMDELELSGRRHLSAKRAAREHRYHSDYIGQLIRSGKVAGQKVGRSWYVDAESLSAYLKGETQPPPPQVSQSVPPPVAVPVPPPVVETEAPAQPPVVEKVVAQQNEEAAAPIHITKVDEPVVEPQPQPIPTPPPPPAPAPAGLRFIPDEEPIVQAVYTMPKGAAASQRMHEAEEERVMVTSTPRRRAMSVALAALALFAFIGALASSYFVVHRTIVVDDRATAAVQLSTQ